MSQQRPDLGIEWWKQYMGLWRLWAHVPQIYEIGCDDETALYTLLEDGTVRVTNTCYCEGKKVRSVQGTAVVLSPTELNVHFSFLDNIGDAHCLLGPFADFFRVLETIKDRGRPNYVVLGSDVTTESSGTYAVVGTPGPAAGALWFLARSCAFDQDVYDEMVRIARDQGHAAAVDRLERTNLCYSGTKDSPRPRVVVMADKDAPDTCAIL
jgi:lipocalin